MEKLLLLHGALGSAKQLEQLKTLLSNDFDVHTFNFSGHGGREFNGAFSTELFSQNIEQYLKENNIQYCHFFGYSMGGYVALYFAKKYPNKIGKIITLATKFDWTLTTAIKEIKMLDPEIIELKVPQFAAQLKDRHAPNDWKMVLNNTADMMMGLGNGLGLKEDDYLKILPEIRISIGSLDKMVTIEESRQVADALPNGQLMILENVEHPIEKVDPQLLYNMIVNFL